MFKCPSCGEDAPFYVVHVQDTTERSAKGPCCFTRGGDLDTALLDGYRIVGGEPTNARALSPAEAVTIWDDYRALHPRETASAAPDGALAPGEAATSPGGAAVVGGFARVSHHDGAATGVGPASAPVRGAADGTAGGAGPIPAPSGGAAVPPLPLPNSPAPDPLAPKAPTPTDA